MVKYKDCETLVCKDGVPGSAGTTEETADLAPPNRPFTKSAIADSTAQWVARRRGEIANMVG